MHRRPIHVDGAKVIVAVEAELSSEKLLPALDKVPHCWVCSDWGRAQAIKAGGFCLPYCLPVMVIIRVRGWAGLIITQGSLLDTSDQEKI